MTDWRSVAWLVAAALTWLGMAVFLGLQDN